MKLRRGMVWPSEALEGVQRMAPDELRLDVQPSMDIFGSVRFAGISEYHFTGGTGVASHDFPAVPHGFIWLIHNFECRHNDIAGRYFTLFVTGPSLNQTVLADESKTSGRPMIVKDLVIPPLYAMTLDCTSLGGSYYMEAHFLYNVLPIGEYMKVK